MNILYIGSGFVGACSAAISSDSGHRTCVFDIDKKKVALLGSNDRDKIESCLHETGLGDLLIHNKDRIHFTTEYSELESFLESADAVFMCLPTPEIGETGESNLTYYFDAAQKLAEGLVRRNGGAQSQYVVIVNKSTVPIDMIDRTEEILLQHGVKNFGVVSNPEFLVEGKAIEGSLRPDRVVVGARSEKDFAVMKSIYQRFYDSPSVQYIEVNPREAAAGKLLANFVLFNKLAVCYDVVGRTCEAFPDVQFEQIRRILTSDPRIGSWGFYDSLYAGGSCFIKDARSLSHQLQTAGVNADIVAGTYLANQRQLELFLSRAQREAHYDWNGKKIALLGLAFKRDTNDIRNAPALEIMKFLDKKNVQSISLYDPAATELFITQFAPSEKYIYVDHEFEAIKDADVVIIATDWPQFRGLADILIAEKKRPLIMDGRRMLQHRYLDLVESGFAVIAVGSPFLKRN